MFQARGLVAVSAAAVLLFVATSLYGDPANDAQEPTAAELLKRIDTLEARVSILEGRTIVPHAMWSQQRGMAGAASAVPKDWGVRQFNGSNYYIVPLHATGDMHVNGSGSR